MSDETIRKAVRERYGQRAKDEASCCAKPRSCCGTKDPVSRAIGYSEEELGAVPEGADLGLGCGNPTALASLKEGETVLDLGAGAGIDCFLAAQAVGPSGRAIGVDMTAEMIERARENARTNGIENVEFRLGEIEHLPVADRSIDVVISNCVVNLSPDKPRVFREAFRALKPGGRMFLSDIVLLKPLPEEVRKSIEAAGFRDVEVLREVASDSAFSDDEAAAKVYVDGKEVDPERVGLERATISNLAGTMASVTVRAAKPA
jgi:arsenite methyltransferase